MDSQRQLSAELRALGVTAGDVVMVHASVRAVGEDGVRVWREMEEFDTSDKGAHPNLPDRSFARLVDGYLAATGTGEAAPDALPEA